VHIESDIVVDVHGVLLIEVSEPVLVSRSRHCSLQENPSSSQPLYIQTVGTNLNGSHRGAAQDRCTGFDGCATVCGVRRQILDGLRTFMAAHPHRLSSLDSCRSCNGEMWASRRDASRTRTRDNLSAQSGHSFSQHPNACQA
jgi:hypothetical protein